MKPNQKTGWQLENKLRLIFLKFSWIILPATLWFWIFPKKTKKKQPQVEAKLSITLYHIIPNILCRLNLSKHLQILIILRHSVTFGIWNHIGCQKQKLFWWKNEQLVHLGAKFFSFFFLIAALWKSSKWNIIQQMEKNKLWSYQARLRRMETSGYMRMVLLLWSIQS